MSHGLEGKQVVITGAGGGLGGAVVEAFLSAGAHCHLPLRSPTVTWGERVRVVAGVDLTDEAQVRAFYAGCSPLWASVHLAGGYSGGPALDTSLADLRRQLDLNLTTAFLCCREALRHSTLARLVNVASRAALVPSGGAVAYSA